MPNKIKTTGKNRPSVILPRSGGARRTLSEWAQDEDFSFMQEAQDTLSGLLNPNVHELPDGTRLNRKRSGNTMIVQVQDAQTGQWRDVIHQDVNSKKLKQGEGLISSMDATAPEIFQAMGQPYKSHASAAAQALPSGAKGATEGPSAQNTTEAKPATTEAKPATTEAKPATTEAKPAAKAKPATTDSQTATENDQRAADAMAEIDAEMDRKAGYTDGPTGTGSDQVSADQIPAEEAKEEEPAASNTSPGPQDAASRSRVLTYERTFSTDSDFSGYRNDRHKFFQNQADKAFEKVRSGNPDQKANELMDRRGRALQGRSDAMNLSMSAGMAYTGASSHGEQMQQNLDYKKAVYEHNKQYMPSNMQNLTDEQLGKMTMDQIRGGFGKGAPKGNAPVQTPSEDNAIQYFDDEDKNKQAAMWGGWSRRDMLRSLMSAMKAGRTRRDYRYHRCL